MPVDRETIQRLLTRVQRPARYAGGELHAVVKDWDKSRVSLALVYPDVYEIGMSNLGLQLLYDVVNRHDKYLAERVYAPWDDMAAAMTDTHVPLYSLETFHPLDTFDVVGFSLQHELTYTNILTMLKLGHIPLLAEDRNDSDPLIIAGGSGAYNPEPLAAFFDAFCIGEGEEAIIELLDLVRRAKAQSWDRSRLIRAIAELPGYYVPSLYDVKTAANGMLIPQPAFEGAPSSVLKRIIPRLGPVPIKPIMPNMRVVHDRAMVEIQRGCSRGCRFCQAGMIYRPIRERPVGETVQAVDELLANTGYDQVSFVSLSSSDHSGIEAIVQETLERHGDDGVSVSLPSLRTDAFSVGLAESVQQTRKSGLTFAPEAGSQRLRDVINKGVTEQDLVQTATAAFEKGWNRIKLYFMLGLPTETDEDALEIARLITDIHCLGRQIRGRRVTVNVTLSTFVPKPHTPFQWEPLASRATVLRRQRLVRDHAKGKGIKLSWSEWDATWLEALISRGDRRLGSVILKAWEMGARFDAWQERFCPELWREALACCQLDPAPYLGGRHLNDPLPWDVISSGVSSAFLLRERKRALEGATSADCREQCHACGILTTLGKRYPDAAQRVAWECP
ncbi:MAG: TIGR03960 family B12-binding radical SAM protein [Anaerolineae bacterium]|nr:TIGR03960 family B12-binding radical SAM protein [Anaerolineae bacterium]